MNKFIEIWGFVSAVGAIFWAGYLSHGEIEKPLPTMKVEIKEFDRATHEWVPEDISYAPGSGSVTLTPLVPARSYDQQLLIQVSPVK